MLPAAARAFAIWGAPAVGLALPFLARELIHSVARKPLSKHNNDRQVNLLVTLVDWAMARASQSGSDTYVSLLQQAWISCRIAWPEVLRNDLEDLPSWLWNAVHENGEARRRLLADHRFVNSQCVIQLNTRAE